MAPRSNQKNQKWGHEATKALVALYELQPTLYKTTSPSYHNKVLRLKSVEHMRDQLNNMFKTSFTTDDVMKKVNNVRTQFLEVHRSCSKEVLHSGMEADEVPKPTWWLYDSLKFLIPYCKKDKGKSNLASQTSQLVEDVRESTSETYPTDAEEIERLSLDSHVEIDYDGDGGMPSPAVSVASGSQESQNQPNCRRTPKRKKEDQNIRDVIAKAVGDITDEKSTFPSHIESLCTFIGHELMDFKHKSTLKKCKWEIINIIRQMQDDEEEND